MSDLKFTDNSVAVKKAIENEIIAWLHEAGGELVAQTQRNSRVDTGQTKGSFDYKVDESAQKVVIGSNLQNAIWEEFGTGEYAVKGNGRKTPWRYQDRNGEWRTTKGKKPTRAMFKAFKTNKPKLKKALEAKLRGLK